GAGHHPHEHEPVQPPEAERIARQLVDVLDAHLALPLARLLLVPPAALLPALRYRRGLPQAVVHGVVHQHGEDGEDLLPILLTHVGKGLDLLLPRPVGGGEDAPDGDLTPAGDDVQAQHRADRLVPEVPDVEGVDPRLRVLADGHRAVAAGDVVVVADLGFTVEAVGLGRGFVGEAALLVVDPFAAFVFLAGVPDDSAGVPAPFDVGHVCAPWLLGAGRPAGTRPPAPPPRQC